MPRGTAAEAVAQLSLQSCVAAHSEASDEYLQSVAVVDYFVPREFLCPQAAHMQLGTQGAEEALVEFLWQTDTGAKPSFGVDDYDLPTQTGEK